MGSAALSKRGNLLARLVLGSRKTSRSPHQHLCSSHRDLHWVPSRSPLEDLNDSLLSQRYLLEMAARAEVVGEMYIPGEMYKGGVRASWGPGPACGSTGGHVLSTASSNTYGDHCVGSEP